MELKVTIQYLNLDKRETDYFLSDVEHQDAPHVDVDLSDEFIERYKEAVDNYDGVQAELDLMFRSKQ